MSAAGYLLDLLDWYVPAWLALLMMGAVYAALNWKFARRLSGHARSIGHMDDWADAVESRLNAIDCYIGVDTVGASGPKPVVTSPHYGMEREAEYAGPRDLTDEQVKAVVSRLGRTASLRRAA